jgi:hypothetical protein
LNKIEFLYPRADTLPPEFLPRRASAADYPWFTGMPPVRTAPDGRSITTVRICPGLMDSMSLGFVIPMPCDLELKLDFEQNGAPIVKVSFGNKELISNVVSHPPVQYQELLEKEGNDWINIKINTQIIVQSSGNVFMVYTKPFYENSNLFEAIPGTVDHALQHQLHFNLKWKVKKPGTYMIKAGTPMLQAIPVPKRKFAEFCIRQPSREETREINSKYSKILARGDYRARQKAFYEQKQSSRCPVTRTKQWFQRIVNFVMMRKGKPL